jgi:uncharacterized membrane protein
MKICPNCGNKVSDDGLFCNNCGSSLANVPVTNEEPAANTNAENPAPVVNQQAQQPVMPTYSNDPYQNQQPYPNGQGNYQQPYMQPVPAFDPSDHTAEFDPADIAENKLIAALPYFFFVVGVIACMLQKDSRFARFHMKNAIRLEIASILALIPMCIPFLGWVASGILFLIIVIVSIIAMVNVLQGKAKDLPIIGGIKFLQ